VNPRNYQKELDQLIYKLTQENKVPTLLLHSCCAPCSSYVLEYLSEYFKITVLYYNPNISPETEYQYRIAEQQRLIEAMETKYPVSFISYPYSPEDFYGAVRGLEQEPEGGRRCEKCFRVRLEKTAELASREGYDFFTTTLSISPMKNAVLLNEIGEKLAEEYGVYYLCSDFKKRNGYLRSVELSKVYELYRQNYCGCVYSLQEQRNCGRIIKD
jgi:hypothetical protein